MRFNAEYLGIVDRDRAAQHCRQKSHDVPHAFTSSYNLYNSNLEPTSATAVINVTTDVVQIQDNGNDLEEEGGNYFVDIEPDELDLSGLLRRLLRQLLRRLL
ncbi:hypothetical protein V8E54_005442 [Elaphomyces granulatus]